MGSESSRVRRTSRRAAKHWHQRSAVRQELLMYRGGVLGRHEARMDMSLSNESPSSRHAAGERAGEGRPRYPSNPSQRGRGRLCH